MRICQQMTSLQKPSFPANLPNLAERNLLKDSVFSLFPVGSQMKTKFQPYQCPPQRAVVTTRSPAATTPKRGAAPTALTVSVSSSPHILVLDDEEMLCDLLQDLLAVLGFTSAFATDGKDAIRQYEVARAAGRSFDALILDLTIPGGMGGKETAQALLKLDPQVKMIVTSGDVTDTVLAKYQEYGFIARLVKPYRFTDLKLVLDRILQ